MATQGQRLARDQTCAGFAGGTSGVEAGERVSSARLAETTHVCLKTIFSDRVRARSFGGQAAQGVGALRHVESADAAGDADSLRGVTGPCEGVELSILIYATKPFSVVSCSSQRSQAPSDNGYWQLTAA